ncbi:OmpA family protein [Spirochaetia bacterium 38H-sp]|uniref:OmpA family protein n=1 Tax=Rarispira pelagica TaxID=3141764 RepID=A0ABU9UAS0_9SPIR
MRFFYVFLLFLLNVSLAFSQTAYRLPDEVKIVEKHNYSHSINGRYVGHIYRELRGRLKKKGSVYKGTAYFLESLTHLAPSVPQRVDNEVKVSYMPDASSDFLELFPTYKAIPFLPAEGIVTGEPWRGFGYVGVDPLGTGDVKNIRVYVEYRYAGTQEYQGRQVHVVSGQFALRFSDDRVNGLIKSEGKHLLTVYVTEYGEPVFIKDSFDDNFLFSDKTSVKNKGFVLVWFYDIVPFDYSSTIPLIVKSMGDETYVPLDTKKPDASVSKYKEKTTGDEDKDAEAIDNETDKQFFAKLNDQDSVEKTEEGIKITIRSLRFVANSAELLAGEEKKLETLAENLKKIPGRTILITGHTADIGRPTAQKNLSIERAKKIVEQLVNLGVDGSRLIYQGKGGTEPIADNSTEEGRALNRRVEITIMED